MNSLKHPILLTAFGLALVSSAAATSFIDINFNAHSVGDNYTVVSDVGTDTGLLGFAPDHFTSANPSGSWSATVDSDHRLNLSASAASGSNQSYIQADSPQAAPASPCTFYYQFDYTRLATTNGILGINLLNSSGQNMLGHLNGATLYGDSFTGAGPTLNSGSTYTLRVEVDSNTSHVRTFVNGVEFTSGLAAANADVFGGIRFNYVASGIATDFIIDNIEAGSVVEPLTFTSASSATGSAGTAFNYQASLTKSPSSFSATGLPAGLSIDTATGLITGAPTESGTFNASVGWTSGYGTESAPLTITVQSAFATWTVPTIAPMFDVDFESPNYTAGDKFISNGDSTLATDGPAPSLITSLYQPENNTWTATVANAGATGNRLTFATPEGGGVIGGFLECFAPPAGGNTGTWYAQMDYTRLTSNGGPLLAFRLVNNDGNAMLNHPNNNLLFADWWSGSPGASMVVGTTHTLGVQVDMATNNWRTYVDGVLMDSYTNANNTTSFGGMQLGFWSSTNFDAGDVFALDNIKVGTVPLSFTYSYWVGGLDFSAYPGADVSATGDADGDGISNAVEFVIGNLPNSNKIENLPVSTLVTDPGGSVPNGDYLKFSYRRTTASVQAGVMASVQYGTDLAGWANAVDGTGGVHIIETADAGLPGTDVVVYIPRGAATEFFGRLSVLAP